jgi:adenosylcobinamide-GDP ribazoletransferase
MGVVAVVLVLMGKVIAFSRLSDATMAVWIVVPVLARTSVVWLMSGIPAARSEGLGTLYARQLSKWTVAGATAMGLLTAAVLMPWREALWLVVLAVASTVLWGLLIRKRFGGSTGDTYGALLEIVEWVGFLAVTRGWGYGR